jgi:ATP-dependent exoDNAse (exonuclease V) alpha subunit
MIKIKFILGEAGTAKSSTIIKTIDNMSDYVCLALTHSAVRNLSNKFKIYKSNLNIDQTYIDNHFKTLHSFFRLKFDEDGSEIYQLNQNIIIPTYIFIDEISLISLTMFDIIYRTIQNNTSFEQTINLILVGDILQLNPISKTKNLINHHNLFNVPNVKLNFHEAMLIGTHLSNNIYSTEYFTNANKLILTKNYRSNSNVINILNEVLRDFKKINKYVINDINQYIENNYIVLSSKYEHLQKIYENINHTKYEYNIKSDIGKLYFNFGDKIILTKNINKDFVNGDHVQIELINNTLLIHNDDKIYNFPYNSNEKYPFLPLNFITIHKAQGLSLDKVIIVLDDMFEITMLYTAITRAINDVKFYINKDIDIKKMKLYNKSFNILRNIIYN